MGYEANLPYDFFYLYGVREIKCKKCGEWSKTTLACANCKFPFPQYKNSSTPELTKEEEHIKSSKPEMSSKMRRYLDDLYQSKNPLKKVLYYLIMSVWSIYVGLVVLMLYLAVLGSG